MSEKTVIAESSLGDTEKSITIALAGNPNSGKTTVFNALTNLRQKVGNYPGVTVEKKIGKMVVSGEREVYVLDLPGTYSLAVRSPDERVARDILLGRMKDTPRPDMVVCIVDASNLERNLYLVSQIQDLKLPVIVVLNMVDTATQQGKEIDATRLAQAIGVPVVACVATQGKGIEELKTAILSGSHHAPERQWRLPEAMEIEMERLAGVISECMDLDKTTGFAEALILISKEDEKKSGWLTGKKRIEESVKEIRGRLTEWGINWRSAAVEARYDWIQKILKDVVHQTGSKKIALTDRLDAILTHRIWGWLIFVALMAVMFFTIFSVASFPMEAIDHLFARLGDIVKSSMPPGDLRDLIANGMIAGVGAVVIFLPQILILFFFIGLLQDTGYMARAAFIMDKLMSRVGLHGKSFIPLLSSFACAVPGIMAARTIESPKDRLVTILVAPLFSCSARLPVYTVMIAALIPTASAWQKASIMLAMYLLGMIGAFVMAWFFKKTLLKSQTPVFIMELPPYRLPSLKTIVLQIWERGLIFLKRAGTVIFGFSILMWGLMSYPKILGVSPAESLRESFAGMIGAVLEPIIKPLGFDWRIGIGLVGSFAAREVFVSTMNIVFNIQGHTSQTEPLRDAFRSAVWPDGTMLFTPLTCISLMVFYVFALQCVSTIAVVRRETNSWRWPLFQVVYLTGLAYIISLCVFQGGKLLGFH